MRKYKQSLKVLLISGLLFVAGLARVEAANTTAIAEGYKADSNVKTGMVVKQSDKDAARVELLSVKDVDRMLGVVVPATEPAVTLSDGTTSQVYVATYGRYNVLVSDQNGNIKPGDYLTISSLDGVAMKADGNLSLILGRAAAAFDGKASVESSPEVKNQSGRQVRVAVGRIPVDVNVGQNPLRISGGYVPGVLNSATQLVTGKPVSPAKTYLSFGVLLVSALIAGNILFTGVRSGMTAIGRNPLARRPILKNLLQIILASLMIFVIGIFAVYLLLKL
ncbi:MAG TPA: hypothetical protein VLG37_00240 [Candidatus Saccharimonadales bacterium]|nr:hypothetical protein [Candidatus Saccharimonadales bacterium]